MKTWYKILALTLCIVMLVAVAPTVLKTSAADSDHTHDFAHGENDQPDLPEAAAPKAPMPNGAEVHSDDPLSVGKNVYVISKADDQVFRPFKPTVSARYIFYSVSDYDTYAVLYDDADNEIASNDDGGERYNFQFSADLTAGKTYYLRVSCPYGHEVGNVTVMIEQLPQNACGDRLTWTFHADTGELELTGSGDMWDFSEGHSPWYSYAEEIRSLRLPDGLKNIGRCAFYGCSALQEVEIPDGVRTVSYHSFEACSSLAFLTIPISLRYIYSCAFDSCNSLTEVDYKGTQDQRDNLSISSDGNAPILKAMWYYLGQPCPHKNTYEYNEYGESTCYEVEDDLWHRVEYTATPCIMCEDCGETISEGTPELHSYMAQHEYEDGVCKSCGRVSKCKHLHTETSTWWNTVTYTDIGDDREHQTSGTCDVYEWCRDCGIIVNQHQEERTVKEPHDYDDKDDINVCYYCRHVNTCKHTGTTAVKYMWEKHEYQECDAAHHKIVGERMVIRYCTVCGQALQTEWEYAEELEDHDFDSYGYCRKCAYKSEETVIDATVEWNANDVKYKGTTPYVIANGKAQTPRFVVRNNADGKVVSSTYYDYEYKENTNAGTGYVIITFKNGYTGTARGWFKIYLPATTETKVENVKAGIRITWKAVPGAAGYVVYRRAWNLAAHGWTNFARWNNTTETSWIDGSDANHRVYGGTRYQYGVKAYFARRTDPVSGAEIGGNVGDNYNLGEVGPLKTTVRITTRTLKSVTAGSKRMTVKWDDSTVFDGYQVQYATDSAFKNNKKTIKIANKATTETVIKNLKQGTTYYVHVRSYHVFEGTTYYGEWSKTLSCKVK